jgi:hypothetical protein
MREEKEVKERLSNYIANLNIVKNQSAINVIKQAILELSWVLGKESNIIYDERR